MKANNSSNICYYIEFGNLLNDTLRTQNKYKKWKQYHYHLKQHKHKKKKKKKKIKNKKNKK